MLDFKADGFNWWDFGSSVLEYTHRSISINNHNFVLIFKIINSQIKKFADDIVVHGMSLRPCHIYIDEFLKSISIVFTLKKL